MHIQINKQIQRREHKFIQFQINVQTQTRVNKHTIYKYTLYNFKSIHNHKKTHII